MKVLYLCFLLFAPLVASAANPAVAGLWRLDPARSTALDGWTAWDLTIRLEGTQVTMQHNMTWRSTKVAASNVFDTARVTPVKDFFRVDQRHMALYSIPGATTPVSAGWLDGEKTLRVEATVPVESSQGTSPMRIYQELRLGEGNETLWLIELHSTRPAPLVYRFVKVKAP